MPARPSDHHDQAPAIPAGWTPAPPDYVGVGTARSGTTWWDALIQAHPRISRLPGTPKEVHFFDDRWAGSPDIDDIAYHRYFARPEGQLSGEWTPGYMLDVWTPPLLRQVAPDARLLVLLRDPVERFRSGRTLAENRFTVGSTARAAANAAFNRGLYADQLLRLWAAFPREQVLVLQYERCVDQTATAAAAHLRVHRPRPGDPRARCDLSRRVNESRGPKVSLSPWQEERLIRRYAPENERLATLVPDLDLERWSLPR